MTLSIRLTAFAVGGMGATIGDPEMMIKMEDASTLQNLLDNFLEKFGKEMIGGTTDYQRQYLAMNMTISVNSKVISHDEAKNIILCNNDSVMIIPPIAGG